MEWFVILLCLFFLIFYEDNEDTNKENTKEKDE